MRCMLVQCWARREAGQVIAASRQANGKRSTSLHRQLAGGNGSWFASRETGGSPCWRDAPAGCLFTPGRWSNAPAGCCALSPRCRLSGTASAVHTKGARHSHPSAGRMELQMNHTTVPAEWNNESVPMMDASTRPEDLRAMPCVKTGARTEMRWVQVRDLGPESGGTSTPAAMAKAADC